jgi:hypothetical protein
VKKQSSIHRAWRSAGLNPRETSALLTTPRLIWRVDDASSHCRDALRRYTAPASSYSLLGQAWQTMARWPAFNLGTASEVRLSASL